MQKLIYSQSYQLYAVSVFLLKIGRIKNVQEL
jgi:hypothetical protein